MNKILIKKSVENALIDSMRTVYDKANKSIISEDELNDEIELIYSNHWRAVSDMYEMPMSVYKGIFDNAKIIAKAYEGRFI